MEAKKQNWKLVNWKPVNWNPAKWGKVPDWKPVKWNEDFPKFKLMKWETPNRLGEEPAKINNISTISNIKTKKNENKTDRAPY